MAKKEMTGFTCPHCRAGVYYDADVREFLCPFCDSDKAQWLSKKLREVKEEVEQLHARLLSLEAVREENDWLRMEIDSLRQELGCK